MTADLESIAQGIRLALGFYLGEWFLDEDKGVPWREQVLVKNPSLVLVNETIRTAIESVEGVASVDSINMDLNTKTRALTGTAVATGDLGRLSITFVEPSQVGV